MSVKDPYLICRFHALRSYFSYAEEKSKSGKNITYCLSWRFIDPLTRMMKTGGKYYIEDKIYI